MTWGGFDEERVAALDLPFEVVHAGTDAALFAELESAYPAQGADHPVGLCAALGADQIQGRMGRVPQIRGRLLHGSGMGRQQDGDARLRQAARADLEGGLVRAQGQMAERLRGDQEVQHHNDEMGALITKVDLDGKKVEDVVAEWMKTNEARWKGWVGQ